MAAVAVTALTAGTVALIRQTTTYAKELKIASQLSGVAIDKLQGMAFATSTVGIGLEKLGDISKDTSEKIGDFLNTGGGGFQDFADAMKLTKAEARAVAVEFSVLSGPQILQEMVTRMEDANVSAVQMSHALEGMASDTTNLIPLLKDGGKAMKSLSDSAAGLTVPLTKEDLKKLEDLDIALKLASESAKNLAEKTLVDLSDWFINAANAASFFFASLNEGTRANLLTDLLPIQEEIAEITKKLETAGGAEKTRLTSMLEKLKFEKSEIAAALSELNKVATELDKVVSNSDGSGGVNEDKIKAIRDRFKSETVLLQEKLDEELKIVGLNQKDIENLKEAHSVKLLEIEKNKLEALQEIEKQRGIDVMNQEFSDEEEALIASYERKLENAGEDATMRLEAHEAFLQSKAALDAHYEGLEIEGKTTSSDKVAKVAKKDAKQIKKDNKDKLKDSDATNDAYLSAAMTVGSAIFEDNKAVQAGMAVVNAASGITRAFADLPYPAAVAASVSIAAVGVTQLAAISSASKGGGSISGDSSSAAPAQQSDFQPETSSLELTDSSESGSQSNTINFGTDSGDDLIDAIAAALNKAQIEGRA